MRKNIKWLIIFTMFITQFNGHRVWADAPDPGAIKLKEVKSMHILEQNQSENLLMDVSVTFNNFDDNLLRFKESTFSISLASKNYDMFQLGDCPVSILDIPAANKDGAPGEITTTLRLDLGPKSQNGTIRKLIKLFNILGMPTEAASLNMNMTGQGKIGREVEDGWIYQTGMKVVLFSSLKSQVLCY